MHYAPYPYTELDIVSTPTLALGIEYPAIAITLPPVYEGGGENPYFQGTQSRTRSGINGFTISSATINWMTRGSTDRADPIRHLTILFRRIRRERRRRLSRRP
ncbi:MAG: hypothetical protein U0X92_17300 [Anaerolineales bacterium]